ncbi:16653_t:CDS:10 [Cetraspora pellucida]|uniref:16653_t:CDS:1 n=1 Tax=Cetraspora pellucida TaxID=1433469 RepID=A0ACA9LDG3_9GLOM|nr:16653_t:CDS:10 [Cetraspora pellucida]
MSVIRPVIPENKEVLEWCSDFSKFETYFDKVPLDRRQEVGGQKLKSLLSETDFPGPIPLSSNNPITFSLSTHQFQSVRIACRIIQKTRLYLQHIEQNVPINVQPAVFHALIPLGNHPYNRDPRHDPVVLFHRWIIRSKYNNVNFGFEFDPDEKSIIMLENLYERLGIAKRPSLIYVNVDLKAILMTELRNIMLFGKRIGIISAMGTGIVTTFPPSEQINYFKSDLDYESVYKVLLRSFEKNAWFIISTEEARALVSQAIKVHEEYAAIKIAVYNALKLQPNASVVKDIIELVKTIYGNFPGVKLSVNQRKFLSLFFERLDNDKVWDVVRKTEGLEFVQYPLEKMIEPLVLLNTRCKSTNGFKHKTNGNKKTRPSQEIRLNIVHDDFQIPKSLKHIQLRPSRLSNTIPSIFQPLNQSSRIGRNEPQNTVYSRLKAVEEFINSACHQQPLDHSKLEHVESLCNNALDDALRVDLQNLDDVIRILIDHSRWSFLNVYNIGYDRESIYQKEFDVIFNMDYDDIRSLRASTHKLIKALALLDNSDMETCFGVLTKLKNLKWAHQVIGSLMVGSLCNRQSKLGQKQFNSQLYGPLTIILMSTECAQRHWPEKSQVPLFHHHIIIFARIFLCIEAAKYHSPKCCYYIRLADIYCLQGSPLKSLSMEAIALKTSFYMFFDKINELWPLHTIKQMIICSLSRKVFHQFIQHEFGCLNETKPLLDLAINDGTLQKSIFTKFIFDVQSKWLRSHLEEQAPSIFSKSYTFSENDKQTKFKNYVKHKSQKEVICVDIDPTHQEIVVDELKRQFMHAVLEWIDEENEAKAIYSKSFGGPNWVSRVTSPKYILSLHMGEYAKVDLAPQKFFMEVQAV